MKNMSVFRAAALCGGRVCGKDIADKAIGSVVIDSRLVCQGDMFVAYAGEKADGHDYISTALDKGAACCLASRVPEGEERCIILADDVQSSLEKICAALRDDIDIPIIGITGSVGKTTAKEMTAAVLAQRLNVLKTDKNLNNQIGVPMTLSRINDEHNAAVIEMGISRIGDMAELSEMVRPNIMVFTVIGHAHLEFLHDLEGVFREKTSVTDYMPQNALVIINGDDPYLQKLSCHQRIMSCGLGANCQVRAENIILTEDGCTDCHIIYGHRRLHAHINAYGRHMVYAALEGAAVGFALGLEDEEIERGIAAYQTVGRRAALCRTSYLTLLDDSYNANPDSMRSSVDTLVQMSDRHVCILGDMLEMGEHSPQMHRDIGSYARAMGVDVLYSCGAYARYTCQGFGQGGELFENTAQLCDRLPGLIKKGDVVLVKASRGAHFEEIAEAIKLLA